MKVKNLFVYNIELVLDEIERNLIKNNIPYVRVGNEIHFENKIYRFIDKNMFKQSLAYNLVKFNLIDKYTSIYETEIDTLFAEKVYFDIPSLNSIAPISSSKELDLAIIYLYSEEFIDEENNSNRKYRGNKINPRFNNKKIDSINNSRYVKSMVKRIKNK